MPSADRAKFFRGLILDAPVAVAAAGDLQFRKDGRPRFAFPGRLRRTSRASSEEGLPYFLPHRASRDPHDSNHLKKAFRDREIRQNRTTLFLIELPQWIWRNQESKMGLGLEYWIGSFSLRRNPQGPDVKTSLTSRSGINILKPPSGCQISMTSSCEVMEDGPEF